MVRTFALIDLATQADAVVAWTSGWTKQLFLEWLRAHGDLHIAPPYDDALYLFISHAGLQTRFRITHDGELVIFTDHSTRMVAASAYM